MIEWVNQLEGTDGRVGLQGCSQLGITQLENSEPTVATHRPAGEHASTREVGGLILLTAFTNISDMAALSFPWLPVRLMLRTRFDNLAKLSRVRAPVLVIHGRHDEIVPFAMGERLFESTGHNDVFYAEGAPTHWLRIARVIYAARTDGQDVEQSCTART
jgi:fermentation-respiration switch protein FrsA (DUF1100 family)